LYTAAGLFYILAPTTFQLICYLFAVRLCWDETTT